MFYEESSVTYTMHSLVHVCEDVKRYGALDNYSAFPFESALGAMKKLLRNGKIPFSRFVGVCQFGVTAYAFNTQASFRAQLSGVHYNGPCLGCEGSQYKQVEYGDFTYSIGGCNAYASLDTGKLVIIDNFIDSISDGIILCWSLVLHARNLLFISMCV